MSGADQMSDAASTQGSTGNGSPNPRLLNKICPYLAETHSERRHLECHWHTLLSPGVTGTA
jgi:hypothetical protein